MIEDEVHFISMAIDAGGAAAKRSDQTVHRYKQHISQDRTLDMTTQPFDHVQTQTIWRQPKHLYLITVHLEQLQHRFGLLKPLVIADQPNLSASRFSNIKQGIIKDEVRGKDKSQRAEDRGQKVESKMVSTLQALSVLALISADVVFVLCAGQLLQCASGSKEISRKGWPSPERNLGLGVLERFRQVAGGSEKSAQELLSALVEQAGGVCFASQSPSAAEERAS